MKHPGVLFMSDGKMENEVDRRIGVASTLTVTVRKELSLKVPELSMVITSA